MKRLTLAVAALTTLATLTSCSGDSSSDDAAPPAAASDSSEAAEPSETATEEATEEPAAEPAADDSERFATTYTQVADLLAETGDSDVSVTTAEEANAAAGLDDTTPLQFVDFSTLEDESGGSYCLIADNGTYLAASFSATDTGFAGEVDLGDGDCSYDPADALVVGDVVEDTWSVGGEYMGDLLPSGLA